MKYIKLYGIMLDILMDTLEFKTEASAKAYVKKSLLEICDIEAWRDIIICYWNHQKYIDTTTEHSYERCNYYGFAQSDLQLLAYYLA